VRENAAYALGNATISTKTVITALLGALKDKNNQVRESAATALQRITKRFYLETMPDLPEKIRSALELPTNLDDESSYESEQIYDIMFDTLNIIAPFPKA